jgi:hypothetical protein
VTRTVWVTGPGAQVYHMDRHCPTAKSPLHRSQLQITQGANPNKRRDCRRPCRVCCPVE